MVSENLYNFISEFSQKRLKFYLNYEQLNEHTTLDSIGIDDLDLDMLLEQFVEGFDIDHSRFNNKRYFGLGIPIIDNNVHWIRKVIGKRSWLPLAKDELEPFTLGTLDLAIERGYLG